MPDKRSLLKFLPVSLNITDKKILIIGGGKVASHKLAGIKCYSENITVLAPDVNEDIIKDPELRTVIKYFEKSDLQNFDIIYACTNDHETNTLIKKDAVSMGKLVNVADNPELCDFISPAIHREGIMTVAVCSNARDVKGSINLRNRIKDFLQND
jgi:siroheme synthase-like protein